MILHYVITVDVDEARFVGAVTSQDEIPEAVERLLTKAVDYWAAEQSGVMIADVQEVERERDDAP